MTKKQQKASFRMSKQKIALIGVAAVIASGIGGFGYKSLIPANSSAPVIGFPANHFIKAVHSAGSGYVYVSQSSGNVKGPRSSGDGGMINPSHTFNKGGLQSIHFINEDYDTHSKHNFNIDAFGVHTRDLGYFETQTMTFVADKAGEFEYYCTIHPEMKGNITIE